jgi:acetoin:2,6-dichlorophenolindophenol oxidoreductase subunit alpha
MVTSAVDGEVRMRRAGKADLALLYAQMCRIRVVEQALGALWRLGLASGEMHLGSGEEGVVAGVLAHVEDGDSLALDYRSTPPLVARGVDLVPLFLEMLGDEGGTCRGRGGHMHLFSREHLAASSGIVGAPAPLACGFGLAAQQAGEGRVAVAFFGDGAVNQGAVMESLNLAAVWHLPVLFVCKDNRWAVTTRSSAVTGGGLRRRVAAFGMPVRRVDGTDVLAVHRAAEAAVAQARGGGGPTFLLASCQHIEGHFLGDPLVRIAGAAREMSTQMQPLVVAARQPGGAPARERLAAMLSIGRRVGTVAYERGAGRHDPLPRTRRHLARALADNLEAAARAEVDQAVAEALRQAGVGAGA